MFRRVFISYSHDSAGHLEQVRGLADRLRADGIDCVLDQYETTPPRGWPLWMVEAVSTSEVVLVVATPTYLRRATGQEAVGVGRGVLFESILTVQQLYEEGASNRRIVPVLFDGGQPVDIPVWLRPYTWYRLDTEEGYDQLYRDLTNQPTVNKPPVGPLKTRPAAPPAKPPWRRTDRADDESRGKGLECWLDQVAVDHRRLADHFDRPVALQLLETAWVRLALARTDAASLSESPANQPRIGYASLDHFLRLDSRKHDWVTNRWLVEGDPGSGKTTLLRYVAARLAKARNPAQIPVFLSLPKLVEPYKLPLEFLAEEYGALCGASLAGRLDDAGRAGHLVLLLDSLDEVPPERRERVGRLLDHLDNRWPTCLQVVSSRPIGRGYLPPSYLTLLLQPLDEVQRRAFLIKWFEARNHPRPAVEAERAETHFDAAAGLRRLSRNPLHLTLLTVLWEKGVEPPRRLSALYDAIFDLLLGGRHKSPARPVPGRADVHEALRHLAYGLTEDDHVAEKPEELERRLLDDALDVVRHRLLKVRAWNGDLRKCLEAIHERTWILGPHDGPQSPWRFWHRTFREALTAERLHTLYRDGGEASLLKRVASLAGDEGRWAEPFALLAGRLDDADGLVIRLAAHHRRLGLRALASTQALAPETFQTIVGLSESWQERRAVFEALPEQVADASACLALIERLRRRTRDGNDLYFLWAATQAVAARWPSYERHATALYRSFFDHIPAPTDSELFTRFTTPQGERKSLWVTIPASASWIGSTLEEVGRSSHEGPRHRIESLHSFALAAVPITNAQYAAFDPGRSFRTWDDVPYDQLLSHPRVRVTWFEAISFCRWLSSMVPGCAGARLPSEEEWEHACRAGTETPYWSGSKEADLERVGWYRENSDRRTHRVGGKSANKWGLHDLHGNVYEWTSSGWRDDYNTQRNGLRIDPTETQSDRAAASPIALRAYRGGSYLHAARRSRSAYRFLGDPEIPIGVLGLRVLLPTSVSPENSTH